MSKDLIDQLQDPGVMIKAAKGANFMQNFKLKVWDRMTNHDGSVIKEFDYIPEKTLDELAMIAERELTEQIRRDIHAENKREMDGFIGLVKMVKDQVARTKDV